MRQSERGNVFYYILIAIVLLGALTFAVANGGRSSVQSLSVDRVKLLASEILDYAQILKTAASQLRLRGIPIDEISFAHPELPHSLGLPGDDPRAEVFNAQGGAVILKPLQPEMIDSTSAVPIFYGFSNENEIDQVGMNCGDKTCTEIMFFFGPLRKDICIQLNDMVGVENPDGDPPAGTGAFSVNYNSSGSSYKGIVGKTDLPQIRMKTAGCVKSSDLGNIYVFYQVLLQR